MSTVVDLVTASLRELGVLASGETPAASDALEGLAALNRMVNAWRAERVYLFSESRKAFTMGTTTTGIFFIGTGAAPAPVYIDSPRPENIRAIKFIDTAITGAQEILLHLMTDRDVVDLPSRITAATYPTAAHYNRTYPYAAIYFWPIPTATTLSGVLYYPSTIEDFAALSTTVALPSGYERMVVKNLALELAPSYGANPSPQLERQAQEAFAVVARSNKKLIDQKFDPGAMMGSGTYDINSDLG